MHFQLFPGFTNAISFLIVRILHFQISFNFTLHSQLLLQDSLFLCIKKIVRYNLSTIELIWKEHALVEMGCEWSKSVRKQGQKNSLCKCQNKELL